MKPIKLFWWNEHPNFGDTLSKDAVAFASGRSVTWSPPEECILFGAGSLMSFARAAKKDAETGLRKRRPFIWGTGSIGPVRKEIKQHVRFVSVRGPLTQEVFKLPPMRYGDPGLLAPEILGDRPKRTDKVGLVIHWVQLERYWTDDMVPDVKGVSVIDPRNPDHIAVIREIASCRLIVSSSLHGLIVADAFGIPSIWLNPQGNHGFSRFKFYDYASSIGRPLRLPTEVADLKSAIEQHDMAPLSYAEGVEETRKDALASFPERLKA